MQEVKHIPAIQEEYPEITVLMSVYNGEQFIGEAIESILNQSYKNFEFLIINDGSTDSSSDIISSYNDPRIRLVDNEQNIGLTRSLNKGLKLARGEYIARMDADDISMPDRLEKQVEYMRLHSDVGLLGSWIEVMDIDDEKSHIMKYPEIDGFIKWNLIFGNVLAHSAAFYRRDLVMGIGGYDEQFKRAQDYDLWVRISFEANIYQIPIILVKWRKSANYELVSYTSEQEKTLRSVMKYYVSKIISSDVSEEQIDILRKITLGENVNSVNGVYFLIIDIFKKFKNNVILSNEERKLISNDVVTKMYSLYKLNRADTQYIKLWGALVSDSDIFWAITHRLVKKLFKFV